MDNNSINNNNNRNVNGNGNGNGEKRFWNKIQNYWWSLFIIVTIIVTVSKYILQTPQNAIEIGKLKCDVSTIDIRVVKLEEKYTSIKENTQDIKDDIKELKDMFKNFKK